MKLTKKHIINSIIAVEGGFVDHPDDTGGPTRWGITTRVARENDYVGEMSKLPKALAFVIYSNKYWDPIRGDELIRDTPELTHAMFNIAVNLGPKRAVKLLQRALNVLTGRCLLIDGKPGTFTMAALIYYLDELSRDEETLVKALSCLQGAYYVEIAERRKRNQSFVYGWLKKRVRL